MYRYIKIEVYSVFSDLQIQWDSSIRKHVKKIMLSVRYSTNHLHRSKKIANFTSREHQQY